MVSYLVLNDSGAVSVYPGFLPLGIRVYHYHRTLADYLDALLGTGLRLARLADLTRRAAPADAAAGRGALPPVHAAELY